MVVSALVTGFSKFAGSEHLDGVRLVKNPELNVQADRNSNNRVGDFDQALSKPESETAFRVHESGHGRRVGHQEIAPPSITPSESSYLASGLPVLGHLAGLEVSENTSQYEVKRSGERIILTLVPEQQQEAEKLLAKYKVPWGAIVAMDPRSGRVLVLASHSEVEPEGASVATRSGFPAASLFKIITASAAVEKAGLSSSSKIRYRGGRYTLNKYNYRPNSRKDRRSMTLGQALGKSCNPAFGRVALQHLSGAALEQYAIGFGFNRPIPFEIPLEKSSFAFPDTDFEVARTAAGFGDVFLNPIHAVLITAAVANKGVMMQPYLVDTVYDSRGVSKYQGKPLELERVVLESTASQVLKMMNETIVDGTARKSFARSRNKTLKKMKIAAKTGTLSGSSPKGVYHWFVAAAPLDNPKLALAALVIDPGNARVNATYLGRRFMEQFFIE